MSAMAQWKRIRLCATPPSLSGFSSPELEGGEKKGGQKRVEDVRRVC